MAVVIWANEVRVAGNDVCCFEMCILHHLQGGKRLTQRMLNTCPNEISHLRVSSKPIQDNGYDADNDETTAAIILKQCRKSLN